jgi:tRNA-2-methylthio-N6-dimethylallyladenosine synthase
MRKCDYRSLPDQKKAALRAPVERWAEEGKVPDNVLAFAQGRFFFIKTYGCQANLRDEEILAGYLTLAGFTKTDDPAKADLALVNTCAVRENAEEKIYGEIGTFKANKDRNPSFVLILAGCVMGEDNVAVSLIKSYPFISLIIGTHEVSRLLPLLSACLLSQKSLVDVRSYAAEVVEDLPSVRLSPCEAYVNISYGCDKFCTYCIVPYTRGRERSRAKEAILRECETLVREGYKEITLLGQNVNSYGLDLKDGANFATLLDQVAALGIPRLRFLTSYPSQFTDAMIAAMAAHENIVKWLHLPVQSGSASCLKRMGRRYTREDYLELVGRIRLAMPDIALTTDLIVAFPGETEEEFADTLSLCQKVGFSAAFTFIYSPRPGTPAAQMEPVPPQVAHERFERLKAVIEASTSAHSESLVGKTFQVLVEGPSKRDESVLSGYAENGKLINFKGPRYLAGCLVPVKVTESHAYSLLGALAGDPLILKARDVSFLMGKDPLLSEYLKLDEALRKDPSLKKLGEELQQAKQRLALHFGNPELHKADVEAYEKILGEIKGNPLLANHDALVEEVEETLLEVRDGLR